MVYDLIVIGAGPAGISSCIYAKRSGLNVLCIDKAMPGGYLNFIDRIDNYPGFSFISGPDLAFKFYEHFKSLDIPFINKVVVDIIPGEVKKVITKDSEYLSKYVIIATGRVSVNLGLEHEEELIGKGISHCALCDGFLYKDRDVAVVGGGESALQEALYLSNICRKVYLIHRRDKFSIDTDIVNKVNEKENIIKMMNSTVNKLNVINNRLSSILVNDSLLEVDCMFTYIGYKPGTKFATSLNITDDKGYILVDSKYQTKEKGIYACGDIIKKDVYQIVTAVSEGCIAATSIVNENKR